MPNRDPNANPLASPTARTAGPRIVALGGGYGLSTTLSAARHIASEITGIVSVADDGGSSGRLRRAFGIPAPGDLRRCLVALASKDSPWAQAFEHRFAASELEGHPLGNIILAGLTETLGSFGAAIDAALDLLGAVGKVYPASVEPVVLKASYRREVGTPDQPISVSGTVTGEVQVGETHGLTTLGFDPLNPAAPAEAIAAIAQADMLLMGPGSLFTSVLAVTALPAISEALKASRGRKIYIANLTEQVPETAGFDIATHLRVLRDHDVTFDAVLYDTRWLSLGDMAEFSWVELFKYSLADHRRLHDPVLLEVALASIWKMVAAQT